MQQVRIKTGQHCIQRPDGSRKGKAAGGEEGGCGEDCAEVVDREQQGQGDCIWGPVKRVEALGMQLACKRYYSKVDTVEGKAGRL